MEGAPRATPVAAALRASRDEVLHLPVRTFPPSSTRPDRRSRCSSSATTARFAVSGRHRTCSILWQPPFALPGGGFAPRGAPIASVSYPPGETLEVFVVGNDRALHGLWKAPHVQHLWQPPFALPGGGVAPPAPTSPRSTTRRGGRSRCSSSARTARFTGSGRRSHVQHQWQEHFLLTGRDFAPAGAPIAAVYNPPGETLEVFVVGNYRRVSVLWKHRNGPWQGPIPLTDPDRARPTTPLSGVHHPAGDQLELFLGDPSSFARVLWKHGHSVWAPCAVPIGPRSGVADIPEAQTSRVMRVTGGPAFEQRGVPGTDLGANTTHDGKHYVFFGDVPYRPSVGVDRVPPTGLPTTRTASPSPGRSRRTRSRSRSWLDRVSNTSRHSRSGEPAERSSFPAPTRRPPAPSATEASRTCSSSSSKATRTAFRACRPGPSSRTSPAAPIPEPAALRSRSFGAARQALAGGTCARRERTRPAPGFRPHPGDVQGGDGVVLLGGGATFDGRDGVHLAWLPLTAGQAPARTSIGSTRDERTTPGPVPKTTHGRCGTSRRLHVGVVGLDRRAPPVDRPVFESDRRRAGSFDRACGEGSRPRSHRGQDREQPGRPLVEGESAIRSLPGLGLWTLHELGRTSTRSTSRGFRTIPCRACFSTASFIVPR